MKERFRERIAFARKEAGLCYLRLKSGDVSVLTKTDRAIMRICLMLSAFFAFAGTMNAYAATGDIIQKVGDIANEYYMKFLGISTAVAGICAVLCFIWIMLSPTANGARTPMEWLKRVIVGYLALNAIGGILLLIDNITAGQSTLPQ